MCRQGTHNVPPNPVYVAGFPHLRCAHYARSILVLYVQLLICLIFSNNDVIRFLFKSNFNID